MDCVEVQAVLSARHDGEQVTEPELAAARAHCPTCPACAAFASATERIDAAQHTELPDGLLERIMAAVSAEATARPERAEASGDGRPASAGAATVQARVKRFASWSARARWLSAAAVLTAAVAVVAVVVIQARGPESASTGSSASQTASAPRASTTEGSGAAGRIAKNDYAAMKAAAPATAPSYISFQGAVFAVGAAVTDTSAVNTAVLGTVLSAFASPTDTPASAAVFKSPAADESIVVRTPQGLQSFAPVVRSVNGVRYQLQTGAPLDRYGVWPTLPSGFASPTAPDGSPTFARASIDANGVTVYALSGFTIARGLAVAPNTSASDPAAGDPNWTWWTPLP